MKKKIQLLLACGLVVSLWGCTKEDTTSQTKEVETKQETTNDKKEQEEKETNKEEKVEKQEVVTMYVETQDVVGNNWKTQISNTTAKTPGNNQSPSLVFDEVENAKYYSIYMIDTTAGNWVHWNANNLQSVVYQLGENPGKYKGPYPPSGTHTYQVHIYALKDKADQYLSAFDTKCGGIKQIESLLDISNGQSGNILGHGTIQANVISGGEVVE